MSMNIRLKGANLILVKVEKMTSAHGVLALPPLFSRRIIETSMSLSVRDETGRRGGKKRSQKSSAGLVPEAIIARPKVGMMVPVRFWFQGELRRYGEKLLARNSLQRIGLFNPGLRQTPVELPDGGRSRSAAWPETVDAHHLPAVA
jgi:asparagine synthase (glutamine-hydrolysing)